MGHLSTLDGEMNNIAVLAIDEVEDPNVTFVGKFTLIPINPCLEYFLFIVEASSV